MTYPFPVLPLLSEKQEFGRTRPLQKQNHILIELQHRQATAHYLFDKS